MSDTIRLCDVEGCGRKHAARGMCARHYYATPAAKAAQARYAAKYNAIPEHKAAAKARAQTPEYRAVTARYGATPEARAANAARNATPARKAWSVAYESTPARRASRNKRNATPAYRAVQAKRQSTPEGRAIQAKSHAKYYATDAGKDNRWWKNGMRRARAANAAIGLMPRNARTIIYEAFGATCLVPTCDAPATDIDHVIALTNEGIHCLTNLQPLCKSHNAAKRTTDANYRPDAGRVIIAALLALADEAQGVRVPA